MKYAHRNIINTYWQQIQELEAERYVASFIVQQKNREEKKQLVDLKNKHLCFSHTSVIQSFCLTRKSLEHEGPHRRASKSMLMCLWLAHSESHSCQSCHLEGTQRKGRADFADVGKANLSRLALCYSVNIICWKKQMKIMCQPSSIPDVYASTGPQTLLFSSHPIPAGFTQLHAPLKNRAEMMRNRTSKLY